MKILCVRGSGYQITHLWSIQGVRNLIVPLSVLYESKKLSHRRFGNIMSAPAPSHRLRFRANARAAFAAPLNESGQPQSPRRTSLLHLQCPSSRKKESTKSTNSSLGLERPILIEHRRYLTTSSHGATKGFSSAPSSTRQSGLAACSGHAVFVVFAI